MNVPYLSLPLYMRAVVGWAVQRGFKGKGKGSHAPVGA